MALLEVRHPQHLAGEALQVAAVARLLGTEVALQEDAAAPALTLGGVTGLPAALATLAGPLDALQQATLLQWLGFALSEVRPYPSPSPQLGRTLGALEVHLAQGSLSGEELWAGDVVVAFPLLARLPSIQGELSRLPLVSAWLARVAAEIPDLVAALPRAQGAGGAKGRPRGGEGGSKGRGEVGTKGRGEGGGKGRGAPPPAPRKLRLLALHGYRQSGRTAREKLGSFRKAVAKVAELEFVTAPHAITGEDGKEEEQFGWWFSQEDRSFDAHHTTECGLGFQESLDTVERAWREGSYDGIMAFSQGASLAAHLCLLQHLGRLPFAFRFAILVAGFTSRTSAHAREWKELEALGPEGGGPLVSLPTLHVMGETDRVIEKEMSDHLMGHFLSPRVSVHPGGHHVPATGDTKAATLAFLRDMQEKLL